VVGAAPGQIFLSQLHSRVGDDLHGDVLELMAIVFLSILRIGGLILSMFVRSGKICFLACRWRSSLSTVTLGAEARWLLWSKEVGLEVVDLSLFVDLVDGMRRIRVQDSTRTSPVDVPQRYLPCYL
jgi:hypothetical protein